MNKPCDNCGTRKLYARRFDIHFSGEDCPYYCEEYDKWKDNRENYKESEKENTD